jgi:polyhydroxybutyrate depolymerase
VSEEPVEQGGPRPETLAVIVAVAVLVGVGVAMLVGTGGSDLDSARAARVTSPAGGAEENGRGSTVPTTSSTTTTTTTSPPADAVMEEVTWGSGPFPRQYTVLYPSDIAEGEDVPVVMALHGLGRDRGELIRLADWEGAVVSDRFVAVFPQGQLGAWNAGRCCPPADILNAQDAQFLAGALADVRARPGVSDDRAFLTGFSNGGMMVYAMACQEPGVFDAIAPVAGSNISACVPAEPVPTLHLHGSPDPVVPYDGGVTVAEVILGVDVPAVEPSLRRWSTEMGCDPDPDLVPDGGDGVRRAEWTGCPPGVTVDLVTYPGNNHSWPTGPVDGLDTVLRFFGLRGD